MRKIVIIAATLLIQACLPTEPFWCNEETEGQNNCTCATTIYDGGQITYCYQTR